jgi:DNA polymerase III subunit delta
VAADPRMVWLVDGDDPVLVGEAVRGLIEELLEGDDPNLAVEEYGGDDLDPTAVVDACRTPPLFAGRRVVVVRDVGGLGAEEVAPLVEYLEKPSPSSALILVTGSGRVAQRLLAAVRAHGHVVGTQVAGREARAWVRERLAGAPIRLDTDAVARLEAHLGEDVSRLGALIDVLVAAYGEGARLGADDLEPYLGEAGGVAPWELTDAIDAGRADVALPLLHRMLGAGGRHPLVVLATLQRHVAQILRVEDPEVSTEPAAAAALGIPKGRSTFPAKKALGAARRLGPQGADAAIGLVADAELALKGRVDWSPELVLEVLVARLCYLSRTGRSRR